MTFQRHMKRRGWPLASLCLGLGLGLALPAWGTLRVRVEGPVAHPGVQQLADGARLAEALVAADVQPDAYVPGAAWLRPSLQPSQRQLKAGLLYDLDLLAGQARLAGNGPLQALAGQLAALVRGQPVTGRAPGQLLDPRPLEVSALNHLLADGDRVLYPARPDSVRVLGAVAHACRLPHHPLQPAAEYLGDCPASALTDPDWLYVIQPDGTVSRHGIGHWNRSPPQPLAPGAVLFRPLPQAVVDAVDPTLNTMLARWFATQPLAPDGVPAAEPAP